MKPLHEKIRIMTAHLDGAPIEYNPGDGWVDIDTPEFSWGLCNYRIKEQPEEYFLFIGKDFSFLNNKVYQEVKDPKDWHDTESCYVLLNEFGFEHSMPKELFIKLTKK